MLHLKITVKRASKKGKSFLENRHFQVNDVQLFTLQGTITYSTKRENEHIIDSKVS